MTNAKKPGRASLAMLAAEAGVSMSTISRIANGQTNRANAETVARVQALIAAHGYRANSLGRSLRSGENHVVAMLAPNLDNPAMGAIASSTEAALREAGYVMFLCETRDRADLQDEYLAAMRAQSVRGYVLVSSVSSPGLNALLERGEPAVLVGRRSTRFSRAPFVGIDNFAAGTEAARFLLRSGVQRPAVIHSSLSSSAIADRVNGFKATLQAAGLSAAEVQSGVSEKLQHMEAGYEAMSHLVDKAGWPAGVLCVSDQMAYGAYRLARERNIAVPQECLLVGVDDNPLNPWIAPWLSSVHVPYNDFGGAVLRLLQAVWNGEAPQECLLPHRLVDRHRT